jgi:hypothetical protein
MTLSDAIQILTTLALFLGVYFTFRRLAPDIGAVKASTAQDNAETDGIKIGNDRTVYAAYKELLDDMSGVLRRQGALEAQVVALEGKLSAALERATAAETAVVGLKKQVEDYPDRVLKLEDIITELRREIARLQEAASASAVSRQMEAQTASTLANTAAQKPAAAGGALHAGDTVTLEAPSAEKEES